MSIQTETPTQDRAVRWLRGPLRPFRNRQYRLLNGSVVFALVAGGVWIIALVWQVIAWGGGAAELSLVSTSGAVGMIAASLLGGVIADRIPQRRILVVVTAVRLATIGTVATLALTGLLQVWMLAIVAFVIGVGNGFTFPAYSALLPMIVPEEDLLAVNGLEGAMRPVIGQVAGPALASAVVAAASPAAAIALVAVFELAGLLCLVALKPVELSRAQEGHSAGALLTDLREGVRYMTRTAWLASTILFAAVLILLIMGPIEVLIPFLLKDRAGGGPGDHAIVLAAFGVGGSLGSLAMASMKLPRRYLTVMVSMWGIGCLPLVLVGVATDVWVIASAVFVVGALFSAPMVIWGTLLQRRVPPALLGRVSSLDFFVSLVFMPVSIAMAGPVSKAIGLSTVFLIAGVVPLLLAVVAIVVAKLPQDEIAHPLDTEPEAKVATVTELPVRTDCDGVPCAQAA